MGLHTTFLGRIHISPVLDTATVDLLRGFAARLDPPSVDHPDAPVGWSPWKPCDDGCCLFWDGIEKPQRTARWMAFLADLLSPHHSLDGMVVGERREHRELFALEVRGSRVTHKILMKGVSDAEAWGDLPLDQERAERAEELRRRHERYAAAVARDLARQEDEARDSSAA